MKDSGLAILLSTAVVSLAIAIAIALMPDAKSHTDTYMEKYADPTTGIVKEDDKWSCPVGYTLVYITHTNYDPLCMAYTTATKKD